VAGFAGGYTFNYTGASTGAGIGVIGDDGILVGTTSTPYPGGVFPTKINTDGSLGADTETEITYGEMWGTVSGTTGSGNWGTNDR